MKILFCLFAVVAAPLAARAQYGPGGNESLATHIYWGEVEAKRQQELRDSQTRSRSSAPRGPMFSLPKYGKMFTGKTAKERRYERERKADAAAHGGWERYPGGYRGKDGQIMKPDGTIVGNENGQAGGAAAAVETGTPNGRTQATTITRAPHTGPMTHEEEKAARRAARRKAAAR